MPERTFISGAETQVSHPSWSAIWAGMFTFVAIWSVFGMLGEAIFASAANPSATHPITGMSAGMGTWAVVLTIIAMFVAGRVTGRLLGVISRTDAVMGGIVMFGLSVSAALVILTLGAFGLGAAALPVGGAHSAYMMRVFADLGWIGFIALLTGWLAAMAGASSAVPHVSTTSTTQEVRRAA